MLPLAPQVLKEFVAGGPPSMKPLSGAGKSQPTCAGAGKSQPPWRGTSVSPFQSRAYILDLDVVDAIESPDSDPSDTFALPANLLDLVPDPSSGLDRKEMRWAAEEAADCGGMLIFRGLVRAGAGFVAEWE